MEPSAIDNTKLLYALLLFMGSSLSLTIILLGWVLWRVKRINLVPGTDFWTALRVTPLVVVVLLDLLDFLFDFLSAPVAWIILSRLGLQPLRGVTVVQQLLPGTQIIPVMTTTWFLARIFKKMNAEELQRITSHIRS